MTFPKKISVIGAGAIGSMFGGLIKFHSPDTEVVLIARGEHCQAMKDRRTIGLRGDWGHRDVPIIASSDPADVAGSDIILFTVKTQDTKETARQFADAFGDAAVVSLQNGINQHALSEFVREDRLLVGMTSINAAVLEPGIVVCKREGVSVIGAASDKVPSTLVGQSQQALAASKLPVEVCEQILGAQYNKLLFNTMGYTSVLSSTDFLNEGIFDRGWRNDVAMPILSESMRVLEAAGIPIERVKGMNDIFRFRKLLQSLAIPGVGKAGQLILRGPLKLPKLIFSVYQDLMRDRQTEFNYVNGEIVRLAKLHSIDAPFNTEVLRMVEEFESSRDKKFWTRKQVVQRFQELANG